MICAALVACGQSSGDSDHTGCDGDGAACKQDGASGSGGTGGVGGTGGADAGASCNGDYQKHRADFAAQYCKLAAACCQKLGTATDEDACRAALSAVPPDKCQSLATGRAYFDANAAAECLTELSTFYASCDPPAAQPPACDRVVHGTLEPGHECSADSDCEPPTEGKAYCVVTRVGASAPVCVQRSKPALGMSCAETDCGLDPKLYCDPTQQICAQRAKLGAACSNTIKCELDLYCTGPGPYQCATRLPVGSNCITDNECIEDAYCNSGTCVAKRGACESCTYDDQCASECDVSNTGGSAAVSGWCAPLHPREMDCFPSSGC